MPSFIQPKDGDAKDSEPVSPNTRELSGQGALSTIPQNSSAPTVKATPKLPFYASGPSPSSTKTVLNPSAKIIRSSRPPKGSAVSKSAEDSVLQRAKPAPVRSDPQAKGTSHTVDKISEAKQEVAAKILSEKSCLAQKSNLQKDCIVSAPLVSPESSCHDLAGLAEGEGGPHIGKPNQNIGHFKTGKGPADTEHPDIKNLLFSKNSVEKDKDTFRDLDNGTGFKMPTDKLSPQTDQPLSSRTDEAINPLYMNKEGDPSEENLTFKTDSTVPSSESDFHSVCDDPAEMSRSHESSNLAAVCSENGHSAGLHVSHSIELPSKHIETCSDTVANVDASHLRKISELKKRGTLHAHAGVSATEKMFTDAVTSPVESPYLSAVESGENSANSSACDEDLDGGAVDKVALNESSESEVIEVNSPSDNYLVYGGTKSNSGARISCKSDQAAKSVYSADTEINSECGLDIPMNRYNCDSSPIMSTSLTNSTMVPETNESPTRKRSSSLSCLDVEQESANNNKSAQSPHKPVQAVYPVKTSRVIGQSSHKGKDRSRHMSLGGTPSDMSEDSSSSIKVKRKVVEDPSDHSDKSEEFLGGNYSVSMDSGLESAGEKSLFWFKTRVDPQKFKFGAKTDSPITKFTSPGQASSVSDHESDSDVFISPLSSSKTSGEYKTYSSASSQSGQQQQRPLLRISSLSGVQYKKKRYEAGTRSVPVTPGNEDEGVMAVGSFKRPPSRSVSLEQVVSRPELVPEKLNFQHLEKFEGEWYCYSLREGIP